MNKVQAQKTPAEWLWPHAIEHTEWFTFGLQLLTRHILTHMDMLGAPHIGPSTCTDAPHAHAPRGAALTNESPHNHQSIPHRATA